MDILIQAEVSPSTVSCTDIKVPFKKAFIFYFWATVRITKFVDNVHVSAKMFALSTIVKSWTVIFFSFSQSELWGNSLLSEKGEAVHESHTRKVGLSGSQLCGTTGFALSAPAAARKAAANHGATRCGRWESENPLAIPGAQSAAESAPHWFAVFTSPRHEKRVAQYFVDRGIEFFLPLYHPTRQWKNRCTTQLDLPLFPGYIFARIERSERVRVLSVPGVLSIVGMQQSPSSIPDAYIEALREGLRRCKAVPHPCLSAGERVRVISGAMSGMEGVLLRTAESLRVVITLGVIGQSMAVELDAADLEPIGSGDSAGDRWTGSDKPEHEMVGLLL